jgi:hypothetical protein
MKETFDEVKGGKTNVEMFTLAKFSKTQTGFFNEFSSCGDLCEGNSK